MTAIPEPGDALSTTLTVRVTTSEREALNALVAERARSLGSAGERVTAASLIRGLVRREIEASGKRKARAPR